MINSHHPRHLCLVGARRAHLEIASNRVMSIAYFLAEPETGPFLLPLAEYTTDGRSKWVRPPSMRMTGRSISGALVVFVKPKSDNFANKSCFFKFKTNCEGLFDPFFRTNSKLLEFPFLSRV